MPCELCREGDLWIKTCKSPSGTLIKVCDLCYAEHATELTVVPGDTVVTARCDGCGHYGNPRELTDLRLGGRKGAYSGVCKVCTKQREEEDTTEAPEDTNRRTPRETIQRGNPALTIIIPEEVLEGLEAVRESGAVNMLCRMDVVVAAHYFGYPAARDWVAEPENFEVYVEVYARGVFEGFEVEVE